MGVDRGLRRTVFLDRDGVLNRPIVRGGRPCSPATLGEFELYSDAHQSLTMLREAGFRLVVVTNQPDVARGFQTRERIEAMHQFLCAALPIDEIRVCFHDDGQCGCRKPLPGLLTADTCTDLPGSFMVGDRWRDVEAGRSAGCATVFIDRQYEREPRPIAPDATVASLAEAAEWILRRASQ